MEIWEAIVLGVIQGLSEFLPISSSGHLELANEFLHIDTGQNLAFTAVVHLGTVMSTVVVFRREIGRLLGAFFRFRPGPDLRLAINLIVSMLPILLVGLLLRDEIEALFDSNLMLVGWMLLLTAGLLLLSQRAKGSAGREITMKQAFIMGIAQAVAVVPGLSRSGATISTGLMLGAGRERVAAFSFLMVLVPVIGENILEIAGGGLSTAVSAIGTVQLAAGFAASFLVGLFACRVMIRLVGKGNLGWFALYCAVVGLFAIVNSHLTF